MTTTPEPAPTETEEKQLCLGCLEPNKPTANFCTKCGAPLSSYAATGPFEHLFAEGSTYRRAAEQPHKLIVVMGVWLIFGPLFLVGLMVISMSSSHDPMPGLYGVWGGLMMLFSPFIIWKTTRNYLRLRRAAKTSEPI